MIAKTGRKSFIIALVSVATLVLTTSCLGATDPPAQTKGYRLYTGTVEGFRISFEYQNALYRKAVEIHDNDRIVELYSDDFTIGIGSEVTAASGGFYANAAELVEDLLNVASHSPEFQVISRGKTWLGPVEAEEGIYSYRLIMGPPFLTNTIDSVDMKRIVAADYGGRIYSIDLYVEKDKYEDVKEGFEHLLATFRFLD